MFRYCHRKAAVPRTDADGCSARDRIDIVLNYEPQPSSVLVTAVEEDNPYIPVPLTEGGFTAPDEKGVYYYMYFANWTTEDGIYTLNQTSAVFAVEVK
ncbi:hypothetical protein R70331_16775 [Paenibacillus sp. FSL R7-0331]|nr:hypothetical protein R70331_16775 [Paenibacillus sp. FSL R7-0331]